MDASGERGLYSAGVAELKRIAAYPKDESILSTADHTDAGVQA